MPLGPLLDAAGLPRTLFDDPENLVDLASAARLLEVAAERSDCPHLGLLCGRTFSPDTIGIVGRLAQNASDVGSALRGLILNLHLHGHAFVPTLSVISGTAEFGMRLSFDLQGNTVPAVDLGMAAAFAIVQSLCGPRWKPVEVLLAHQPLGSREPYDRIFGVRAQFGSDRNAIAFDAAWLARRVYGANAATRRVLERELAVIAQRHRLPATTTARRALIACIARGNLSVAAVATVVGLHPRTLNRRLAREGTSVAALTKAVRFQIARDLLENTALPITEIAATLLYADIGAFTRAFRLWSRMSPSDWRLHHRKKKAAKPNAPWSSRHSQGSLLSQGAPPASSRHPRCPDRDRTQGRDS
ncbi:MAG: AraC family transcriptional regulator [Reyranellaceae bacterium]